jgi:hypothetical protein
MDRWLHEAGLSNIRIAALPPPNGAEGLTVKIWAAERGAEPQRSAA